MTQKKMLSSIALFLSVLAFSACSKDNNGGGTTVGPINNLVLPASPINAGDTIVIQGSGFTTASQIWFSDANNTKKEGIVDSVYSTGIRVITPTVYDAQSVILNQDGIDYTLGSLTFSPKKIKLLTKMTLPFIDTPGQTQTYDYAYDANNRLKQVTDENYKESGTISYNSATNAIDSIVWSNVTSAELEAKYAFTYSNDTIYSKQYSYFDKVYNLERVDTLIINENKQLVELRTSYSNTYDQTFTYDGAGNLLKSITNRYNGQTHYTETEEYTYDDKSGANSNTGVPAWFAVYNNTIEWSIPLSLGFVNNQTQDVYTDTDPLDGGNYTANISYDYDADGYPSSIIVDGVKISNAFEYKVLN